jgi:hypothetical protein
MAEEDGETWYCYYAVMKLHWKPHDFVLLPPREKALMIAFIDERLKPEKKEIDKIKASGKGGRR